MAINIKTPMESTLTKGTNSPSRTGTSNGEPGYQKRTSGAGGPAEKTYEADYPKGNLNVKSPAAAPTVKK